MTKQLLSTLAALGLVVSVSANAAMKSEFFYQTDAEKNQITPVLMYNSKDVKFDVAGVQKAETTATTLNLSYERGINEMLSAGVRLPYTTTTMEQGTSKEETKGIGDITLFLKGNHTLVEGQALWFGADLGLSPGDHTSKVKSATKTEDNNYAGGHSITPYVGYSMLVSSWVVGTRLSTTLGLGDRTVKTTSLAGTETKTKDTGANTTALTVFGEMPITAGNVGAKVTYAGIDTLKSKDAAGATTRTAGHTTIGLGVYGNYDFSEAATLVGGIDYTKLASDSYAGVKVDSTSDMAINVGGRFTF